MPPRTTLLVLVSAVAMMSCAARLAVLPSGALRSAIEAEAADVQVRADWNASTRPCECPGLLPLLVTIRNGSDHLVAVRYEDFSYSTGAGLVVPALPPFDLTSKDLLEMPKQYPYAWTGFQLAPHLGNYYRGFWNSTVVVQHDPAYYSRTYAQLAAATEITDQMRRHALPEGLLEPDGRITGLLYFVVPSRFPRGGTLRIHFNDAASGRRVVALELVVTIAKARTMPEPFGVSGRSTCSRAASTCGSRLREVITIT